MKIYKEFLEFTHKNYKSFIFVVLFYSLWLAYKYAITADTTLLSFPGRMIGEATLNAYDINKRIKIFYYTGFIFFLSNFIFLVILWTSSRYSERFLKSSELKIFHYTSIAGIIFLFFNLWTQSFGSSFELIYCIHKIIIVGFVLKWVFLKKQASSELINTSFYSISLVLGVSFFFLLTEIALLFDFFHKPDFFVVLFITSLLALISGIIIIKQVNENEVEDLLNKFAYILVPIASIPMLSFFKDEISLILNRHEITFFSPSILYICMLFIIAILILWRIKRCKIKNDNWAKTNEEFIATRYFPLLVLSVSIFFFYLPVIDISNEMFEAGNQILPIMEFQKFGVVPVFEKFNSHNLSELFCGSIYTFFNGLQSKETYIYEFLLRAFWAFMVYHFMFKLTKNAYIALFAIFFFPFIDYLLYDSIIICLLALYVTSKVIQEKQSFKNYFLLFTCLAFLLLWRIDVGYPSIIASITVLLTYQINHEKFQINFKLFFKVLFSFLGIIALLLLILGWWRNINVFSKLWSGLNYLASSQSYGVSYFGDSSLSVYKVEYFVFPLVILLGIGVLLVFFKKFNVSGNQGFVYSSFLFMAMYYLVNFQRGMVRHGINEGSDARFSSFSFFLFSAGVFLFFQHKSSLFKFIIFICVSVFLLMNYKFPTQTEFSNLYSKIIKKTETFSSLVITPNMSRCTDTTNYEEKYFGNFKKFISKNLNDKQTFIDFSNLPMLYYFSGKISPSYFYQNPLTIHNDYLQKNFISELSEYDAPLIVFSNFPENWWDNVDGVPNPMRHYRLAEYFYQHYKPFVIVDNLCIWKRNDFKLENNEKVVYSYVKSTDSAYQEPNLICCSITESKEKNYLFKLSFNENAPEIKIQTKSGSRMMKSDFISEIGNTAYYILKDIESEFSMEIKNDKNIRSVILTANEYIPDFYSFYPQKDDLLELPHIWASYDKSVANEKMLLSLSQSDTPFVGNNPLYFNFNSLIDKTSGNTVFITLEANNAEPSFISLKYGSKAKGNLGEFIFKVISGVGQRNFAIRISSHYNWYDPSVNYISLVSWPCKDIVLKKIELLKAE